MGGAGERGAIWKICHLAQFFPEPKTAVKNKVYEKRIHHFLLLCLRDSVVCLFQWPLGATETEPPPPVWAVHPTPSKPQSPPEQERDNTLFLLPHSSELLSGRVSINKPIQVRTELP